MARIKYSSIDTEQKNVIAQRIVKERGSVLHLYQMLLHSPAVAEGWLAYLTAIRQKSSLNAGVREMVIILVAKINGAPYEAEQHLPIALREGVSAAKLEVLGEWQGSDLFSPAERAVLEYTSQMTRKVHVSDEAFSAMAGFFSEQEVVELTATVAAYNMVSRFLEALGIDSRDSLEPSPGSA